MTDLAIAATTEAFKALLEAALRNDSTSESEASVYIGPPISDQVGGRTASLFLFQLQPNAELRNEQRFGAPPATHAATQPAEPRDALPLDLRYLISVFRVPRNASEANELTSLGRIIQAIHARPTLSGAALPDQTVRLTPEAYPMEEMSRVWSMFPDNVYCTSVVYLASPVFIDVGAAVAGPPVRVHRRRLGIDGRPSNALGADSAGGD